jgi:hypothetical protein
MKIASVRTTSVLAPLPRPVRTASGTINQFPLVLIDVCTDANVVGRAYAQVYLPELLPALERGSHWRARSGPTCGHSGLTTVSVCTMRMRW